MDESISEMQHVKGWNDMIMMFVLGKVCYELVLYGLPVRHGTLWPNLYSVIHEMHSMT